MRLMFVHDHVFRQQADGTVLSPGRLPYSAWQRYLEHFEHLTVVARSIPARDIRGLNVSSGPRVEFRFDHGYRGPKDLLLGRRSITAALADLVSDVDALVVRLPSELGLVALAAARVHVRPCAVEVVGCAYDAYANYGSIAARAYAPIAFVRMRRATARASHAIYVTRSFLQGRYPCSGSTACASNVQLESVDRETLSRRREHIARSARNVTVGFMGSLKSAYKGLDVALRAVRILVGRGRSVRLRVLGDGDPYPWQELARKLDVEQQVQFEGVLPAGPSVLAWLDELDLFVQPSKQEGLPRSLIEAMSRGLPSLASTTGGIPELLPAERLHRPGDAHTLATQMELLLDDSQALQADAERNWRVATQYVATAVGASRNAFWREFRNSIGNPH